MRLVGSIMMATLVFAGAGASLAQNAKTLGADEITKMLQNQQTAEVINTNKLLEMLGGTQAAGTQRVTRGVTPHAVPAKTPASVPSLPVEFEFNKATLTKSASTQLDELSAALMHPSLATHSFEIAGHTDAKGSDKVNKKLSQQRAEAVVSYLAGKGIERDRLRAMGKGEEELFDPADPYSAKNRRVEVKRLD